MSDDTWHTLLQHVLIEYVMLLTNLEGPALSAPTLTRKEIIEHDTARKEACATAIAAAAAAAADGGDSGGNGGGDGGGGGGGNDATLGHGDEDAATQPAAAKALRGAAGGEKEEVSLLWAALSPGTIAMVARGIKHS